MIKSICQESDSHASLTSITSNYHRSCCALQTTLVSVLACEKEHVIKNTPTSKSKKKERSRAKQPLPSVESSKKEQDEHKLVIEKTPNPNLPVLAPNSSEKVGTQLPDNVTLETW